MNISTVRDNLKNTIAGKEMMLKGIDKDTTYGRIIAQMLDYNITDLQRILADVELCMNTEAANSWAGAVDRQSGAFDESELRGRDGWL